MPFKSILFVGALALFPAIANAQVSVQDAYARAASPIAISGAAFMVITNATDQDDRLVAAASDIAEQVELHTHMQDEAGVMRMIEVEEGFAVPAGGMIALERGGNHVMFLGLRQSLTQGDEVTVTLEFEQAGPMTLTIPVDLER